MVLNRLLNLLLREFPILREMLLNRLLDLLLLKISRLPMHHNADNDAFLPPPPYIIITILAFALVTAL